MMMPFFLSIFVLFSYGRAFVQKKSGGVAMIFDIYSFLNETTTNLKQEFLLTMC